MANRFKRALMMVMALLMALLSLTVLALSYQLIRVFLSA